METTIQILEKKHPYVQDIKAMMDFFTSSVEPKQEKKGGNHGK